MTPKGRDCGVEPMQKPESALIARPVFADLVALPMAGDLVVSTRDELILVAVGTRKNQRQRLVQRMSEKLGVDLPCGSHCRSRGTVAVLGMGPDSWWVTYDTSVASGTDGRVATDFIGWLGDTLAGV